MNTAQEPGSAERQPARGFPRNLLLKRLGVSILLVLSFYGTASAGEAGESGALNLDDASLMRRCFTLAQTAVDEGNEPFGALLVKDGRIIMTSRNTVNTDQNTTHHAETNLIAAVSREYGPKTLHGATLYTSAEPCPMCCGAIYMAGISGVVYGLSTERLEALSGFKAEIPARPIFSLGDRKITVSGPLLEQEAERIIRDYLEKN